MKNSIQTFLLISFALFSCSKEDVTPIKNNPAFNTVIVSADLPASVGGNTNNFQDAIMLEDGKMLIIIDYILYAVENNIYTEKINSVIAIKQTDNKNIYVLGSNDDMYTSVDLGESFTVKNKFVGKQGQDYALELYYNGRPNNMLIEQLPDGSFIMWLYTQYNYSLGGTGFTQKRYQNYVFTSTDGLAWEFQPDAGAKSNSYPASIDNNGLIYLVEVQTDTQSFSESTFYSSNDLGISRKLIDMSAPNAISNTNNLFYIDRIAIDTRFESIFQQWDGENWIELNPTIDETAKSVNSSQLIISKVSFTPKGNMVLINSHGIYQSDITF